MPRNISDALIQSAQSIVQQLQSQQQLALQQAQFGQQIKAAEESLQLKQDNLKLAEEKNRLAAEKNQLDAELAVARFGVSERNAATAEAQVRIAEGRLALDQSLRPLKMEMENARLDNIKARTKALTDKMGKAMSGEVGFNSVGGRFVLGQVPEQAEMLITTNPAQFIEATPEQFQLFGSLKESELRAQQRELGRLLAEAESSPGLSRSSILAQRAEQARTKFGQLNDYIQKYRKARLDIETGANKDAFRTALRSVVATAPDPDAAVDQLLSLERAGFETGDTTTGVDLQRSFIKPDMFNSTTRGRVDLMLDTFESGLTADGIETMAEVLDDTFTDTDTPEAFAATLDAFVRYAEARSVDFDGNSFAPVFTRLMERRGFAARSER